MGLAPLQRERLSTSGHGFRCNGACPTFPTGEPSGRGPRKKGDRHRAQRFPAVSGDNEHGASPLFSLAFTI